MASESEKFFTQPDRGSGVSDRQASVLRVFSPQGCMGFHYSAFASMDQDNDPVNPKWFNLRFHSIQTWPVNGEHVEQSACYMIRVKGQRLESLLLHICRGTLATLHLTGKAEADKPQVDSIAIEPIALHAVEVD